MRRDLYFYFLLFNFCLLAVPHSLAAQDAFDRKIRGSYQEESLDLVFLNLELNHRLDFHFDPGEVAGLRISKVIPRLPLDQFLTVLLEGTSLSFRLQAPNSVFIELGEPVEAASTAASTFTPTQFDFTITGLVEDALSGERLPFANLMVYQSTLGATTNVDGWFTVFDVPSDTALIEVSYIGYQTQYFRLEPGMDMGQLEFALIPGTLLQEVTVEAAAQEQMMQASVGISQIAIAPAQIKAIPSLGERDIFRSLQLLPGVSGSNESSSGLYVRGGTPDQNLVLFDGFTVYHVDHLFGFFSAFNSNAVKDVQLYKGGFGAEHGGRLSSVVDITGKDGNTERFNIGGGLSLLSANVFAEVPFAEGQGTILLAGRRSFQSEFYNDLLEFSDGDSDTGTNEGETEEAPTFGRFGNTAVEPTSWFYDLNAKVTYRLGEDILSLSFYNGQDRLDNGRNNNQNNFGRGFGGIGGGATPEFNFNLNIVDESNWGNTGASVKWSRRWNDQLYSKVLLSSSNYFSYRDRGVNTVIQRDTTATEINNGTTEDNDLNDLSFKWDWEWQPSPLQKLSFGLMATSFDIKYDFLQNDTVTVLARDDQGSLGSAYLQGQSTLFDRLILRPGVRASYFDETGQLYAEPRLQLQYLATDEIKIKAATGRYYQVANRIIREDISQGSRDFWVLSDGENVPVSRSDHFILGIGYETSDYLFDVEAYHKNLEDITEYSTRFVLNGFGRQASLDFEENFFTGSGTARGVELLAQKKSGALNGWISYTLGRVEHQFDVFGESSFPASHDVTNELKIVGMYRVNNWSFGGTFVYATGRPYTAPIGAYEVELLDGNTTSHFAVSDKNTLRLPDYHRLDLSINYDFDYLFGGKASTGLSFFNVYGRQNVWYKEYEVVDGVILETDVNLLGFTPSLYFNWSLH